jgi:hypothetical protein
MSRMLPHTNRQLTSLSHFQWGSLCSEPVAVWYLNHSLPQEYATPAWALIVQGWIRQKDFLTSYFGYHCFFNAWLFLFSPPKMIKEWQINHYYEQIKNTYMECQRGISLQLEWKKALEVWTTWILPFLWCCDDWFFKSCECGLDFQSRPVFPTYTVEHLGYLPLSLIAMVLTVKFNMADSDKD